MNPWIAALVACAVAGWAIAESRSARKAAKKVQDDVVEKYYDLSRDVFTRHSALRSEMSEDRLRASREHYAALGEPPAPKPTHQPPEDRLRASREHGGMIKALYEALGYVYVPESTVPAFAAKKEEADA